MAAETEHVRPLGQQTVWRFTVVLPGSSGEVAAGVGQLRQVRTGALAAADAAGVLGRVFGQVAGDLVGVQFLLRVVGALSGTHHPEVELSAPGEDS